jgi:hypothetical protein
MISSPLFCSSALPNFLHSTALHLTLFKILKEKETSIHEMGPLCPEKD